VVDAPDSGEVVVAPDAAARQFGEALDWLEEGHRRSGGGAFSLSVLDGDESRRDALSRRGYERGEGGALRF
jgi:hypothetical protein